MTNPRNARSCRLSVPQCDTLGQRLFVVLAKVFRHAPLKTLLVCMRWQKRAANYHWRNEFGQIPQQLTRDGDCALSLLLDAAIAATGFAFSPSNKFRDFSELAGKQKTKRLPIILTHIDRFPTN